MMEQCGAMILACSENRAEVIFSRCVCEKDPDCDCEKASVSPYSEGPVGDGEMLARFAMYPTHYRNGTLDESIFDDMFTHGMSCSRIADRPAEEVHQTGIEHASKKGRRYCGYVVLNAGSLRAMRIHNRVRVYDTSGPDYVSHADVVAFPTAKLDDLSEKQQRKLIRTMLIAYSRKEGIIPYESDK